MTFCDRCEETLQKIIDFKKECLNSIDYLRSKLKINAVFVKEEVIDPDDAYPEVKIEEINVEEDNTQETDSSDSENETSTGGENSEQESDSDEPLQKKPEVVKKRRNVSELRKVTPSIKRQVTFQDETSKKVYSCNECDHSYTTNTHLKRHILKKHQGKVPSFFNSFKTNVN